jgi:hypothetical protein
MKKLDYYSGYSAWRMPKWMGAVLGGTFMLIAIVSACAIVKLTRPARVATVAPTVAPSVPVSPALSTPSSVVTKTDLPPVARQLPSESAQAKNPGIKRTRHVSHGKHVVLAKHESRAKGKSKSDIERILGL